jgi:hypothetical protein
MEDFLLALDGAHASYRRVGSNDVILMRRDGARVWIRRHWSGVFDWSINQARTDDSGIEYRGPNWRSAEEVLIRVRGFLSEARI